MSRDIAIFHIIIEITNADRGFVSNELLMKKYGKCEKTISSALTNLKKIGLITITIVNVPLGDIKSLAFQAKGR